MSSNSVNWDLDEGGIDMEMEEELELPRAVVTPSGICQKFSSELRKKFQVRNAQDI